MTILKTSIKYKEHLIQHAQILFELRPGEGEVIVSKLIKDINIGRFPLESGRNTGK